MVIEAISRKVGKQSQSRENGLREAEDSQETANKCFFWFGVLLKFTTM
jgi:hypothetical protein